jgi:TetR/AcrR family transcriptional regulator, cholesterol catabolism regulator
MPAKSVNRKKEYIGKIARDVFVAKGYKAASLHDISAKGKISKAGIYHYFKSKGDILSYVILTYTDSVISALKECLRTAEDKKMNPRKSSEALIKTYAKCILKNKKNSLIVLRDRHQLTAKERNKLVEKERAIFHILRSKFQGIRDVNSRIDINLISFQIIAMTHWMGYWFDSKGSLSEGDAIDQMVDIIFHGILDKEDGERV